MKKFYYIVTLAVLLTSCKSIESVFKWHNLNSEIFPFYENGLWGFNNKDGSKLIETQFEEAYLPKHGLIRVKKNGKYGFIDEKGKLRIKFKYSAASDYHLSDQLTYPPISSSKVQFKNETFYIDEYGKKTSAIWKESIEPISNSIAMEDNQSINDKIVSVNNFKELIFHYHIENEKGEKNKIIDTTNINLDTAFIINNSVLVCKKKGKYGILFANQLKGIPADGNPYQEHIYKEDKYQPKIQFIFDDFKVAYNNQNQKSQFYFKAKKGKKWGIVNIAGNTLVPFQYISIKNIEENGFALVEYDINKFGYLSLRSEYSQTQKTTYFHEQHFKF